MSILFIILYHIILLLNTYLFLLIIICLTCNLFFKTFIRVLNVKISSASLMYAH
jgi:hypothetical protein